MFDEGGACAMAQSHNGQSPVQGGDRCAPGADIETPKVSRGKGIMREECTRNGCPRQRGILKKCSGNCFY